MHKLYDEINDRQLIKLLFKLKLDRNTYLNDVFLNELQRVLMKSGIRVYNLARDIDDALIITLPLEDYEDFVNIIENINDYSEYLNSMILDSSIK